MEFSLRRPSFKKSPSGSSSSSSKHHVHHHSSSHEYHHDGSDEDDSPPREDHPMLTHHHRHISLDPDGELPKHSLTFPGHGDEVIVKIDSPVNVDDANNTPTKNSSSDAGNSAICRMASLGEFSFHRPLEEEVKESTSSPALLGQTVHHEEDSKRLSLYMNKNTEELQSQRLQHLQQQQKHPHHHHDNPRQGFPPLPPHDPSQVSNDIQNPDFTNSYKTTTNTEGSREIRVSFQESLNSDHKRHHTSMYNTIEGDSSSSCDSGSPGDEEGHKNINHSGEVLRHNSKDNMGSFRSERRLPGKSFARLKSRLIDPPSTPLDQQSGGVPRSGPIMRSGFLGKSTCDEDEDDPFDDDLPEQFKRGRISTIVVLEWVSLVAIVGALICSLWIPVLRKKIFWNLILWKWEVLILVLICGRLVSDWGIRILVFFIERNFLLRKRVLYFVYGLKSAVQNVIWLGLVLATWRVLFDKKLENDPRSYPLWIVSRILVIGEIGAVLWLLKTFFIKVCASTFHVNAFFDRIQDSLFNQFVIETLSAPPLFELHQDLEEDGRIMAEVESLENAGIIVPPELRDDALRLSESGRSAQTPTNQRHVRDNAKLRKSPFPTSTNEKIFEGNATPYRNNLEQSFRHSGPMSKKHDEGITIDRLHRMNQKNVSAWNMKKLMKIIRHGALTTLDEPIVNTTGFEDESATQIRSEVEAKAAAKKIFRNVAKPHSKYIFYEDLLRFMPEDEVLQTMGLFEGATESEKISKRALKNWVVTAFRERKALALTLSDTKTAVNKLHTIVNVIVIAIILLIAATWLNIIEPHSIVFISSQVVVVAFVFGNTCKNIFESIIFLFVVHPFDVGDRCDIDGIQMVVEEMNILTTVFLRYDNLKIIYPNYILLSKPISNYYRSPDMGDAVELCFHIATPTEKIAVIRQRIVSYIENTKEHWKPSPTVLLKDMDNAHMLRIAVWLCHRMNHHDMGERFLRRALLIEECVKIFREMDIEFREYPININVNSMPPLNYANVPSLMRSNDRAPSFRE